MQGRRLRILDARKHTARRFADVAGKPGQICAIHAESIEITVQGGRLEVLKVRVDRDAEQTAADFVRAARLEVGDPITGALVKVAPAKAKTLESVGA